MKTLLDSIREYAARPWASVSERSATYDATLSVTARLACAEHLANHIRAHSPGYAEARQADLEHHLRMSQLFALIHARKLHS